MEMDRKSIGVYQNVAANFCCNAFMAAQDHYILRHSKSLGNLCTDEIKITVGSEGLSRSLLYV